jgi:tRNA 2-thiocytidine biosynthesis protein TtcA
VQSERKKEPEAIKKIAFGWFKKAIEDYHLLADGEKVLVGFSGGKDSLCLLHLFLEYNKRKKKGWQIFACHIDPGFPNWARERIEKVFRKLGVDYEIMRLAMVKSAFFLSREQKKQKSSPILSIFSAIANLIIS